MAENKKALLERKERSVARAKRKAEMDAAPPKKCVPKGRPPGRKVAVAVAPEEVVVAVAPVEVMGEQ
jgi:hypothetical protein